MKLENYYGECNVFMLVGVKYVSWVIVSCRVFRAVLVLPLRGLSTGLVAGCGEILEFLLEGIGNRGISLFGL